MSLLGEWTFIYIVMVIMSVIVAVIGFKIGAQLKLKKIEKEGQEVIKQ